MPVIDGVFQRIYHKAEKYKMDGSGSVSALCSNPPRRINLNRAFWTMIDSQVTCKKCLKIMGQASSSKNK